MSEASTQYDVALRYVFKDGGAARGVDGLSHKLEGLSKQGMGVGSMFATLGATIAGAFGAHKAYEYLVGFNAEMESMKISMTALTQANLDEPFELARTQMDGMVADFTQFAKQSPLTTKEIVNFAQGVEAGVFSANGSLDDFKNIAEQGALAAKMLGADANYAGTEIQEMLQGSVRKNMRFARNLLGFAGEHDTEAFNAKSDLQRLETVKKALNSPAMKQAGKQFAGSFEGVTSTLKDQLQIAFGSIGLPLFKQLTDEVKKWTEWIDKNPDKIRQFAADFQSALADGFRMFKEVASFIVEHKELLMSLAKAFLVGKAVGFVSGSIQGMVQTLASLAGTGAGSLGALGLSLSGVTLALAAFAGAATMIADGIDERHDRQISASTDWGVIKRGQGEFQQGTAGAYRSGSRELRTFEQSGAGAANMMLAQRMVDEANNVGFVMKDRGGNKFANAAAISGSGVTAGMSSKDIQDYIRTLNEAFRVENDYLKGLSTQEREALFGETYRGIKAAFEGAADVWAHTTVKAWGQEFDAGFGNKLGMVIMNGLRFLPILGAAPVDMMGKPKNDQAKTNVNVTINRVEVQADDPDRLIFGLAEIGRRAAKAPGRVRRPLREG